MKKYHLLSLLLVMILLTGLLPVQAAALDQPEIISPSAVLLDANTGDVLFEKDGDRSVDPASTAALMTALLVGEAVQNQQIGLTDEVIAPNDVLYDLGGENASILSPAIQPGESLTVDELLHCITMRSSGDACNTLAAFMSGSISAFIQEMNTRAGELGCTGTHFENTHGEPVSGQYSTAHDMALIARAVAATPVLVNICDSTSYTVTATNMNSERRLTNSNQLMAPDSEYYYDEAYGLKAGYAVNDGYCVAAAATSGGINAIAVIMGSAEGSDRFKDAITLFDWVFDNYAYRTILSDTEAIDSVSVTLGTTDTIGVRAESRIELLMPNDQELTGVDMNITYYHEQQGRDLVAPIDPGTVLGEVTVSMNGEVLGSSRVLATSNADMSRLEYMRTQIEEILQSESVHKVVKALIIMFAVYLLLVLFYWFQRVRHLVSLRRAKRDRARALANQEIAWLELPDEAADASVGYFPEEDSYAQAPAKGRRSKKRRDKRGRQPVYDDQFYDDSQPYDDGQPYDDDPVYDDGQPYDDSQPYDDDPAYDDGQPYDDGPAYDDGYYDDSRH